MTYLEEVNGRSITVRNVEYTIEVLPAEEIYEMAGEEVFGLESNKNAKIYLRDGMNDDRAEQTLLHELLHAMFFESGYIFDNQEQEEEIVNALSLVMHDMSVKGSLDIALDEPSFQAKELSDFAKGCGFLKNDDKPLFPQPTLFCENDPFTPNMNYEDTDKPKKPPVDQSMIKVNETVKPALNMYLVSTLWNTYTVNPYGKKLIELANKEGEHYVKVYDFQTKKSVNIVLEAITHIEELPEEEK